jgi:hypothetical protein
LYVYLKSPILYVIPKKKYKENGTLPCYIYIHIYI